MRRSSLVLAEQRSLSLTALALLCLTACSFSPEERIERLARPEEPPSARIEVPPLDPGTYRPSRFKRADPAARTHRYAKDYPVANSTTYIMEDEVSPEGVVDLGAFTRNRQPHAPPWDLPKGVSFGSSPFDLQLLDGKPKLLDRATGEEIEHAGTWEREVDCAALSPDGTKMICGHARGVITMTDLVSGMRLWEHAYVDPDWGPYAEFTNSSCPRDFAFSTDGMTIAVVLTPPIRGLFLDALDGRALGVSAPGAGRMGSSAEVFWMDDDQMLFHHESYGPLHHVRLDRAQNEVIHRIKL